MLFDEVSRCRPELQNKLFPLIHERVAQGLPLTRLRHRWAAMNPPPGDRPARRTAVAYDGAEPLDVALADRFAFVLEVPVARAARATTDRRAVLLRRRPAAARRRGQAAGGGRALPGRACAEARGASCAGERPSTRDVLAAKLAAAGHPLSTRRAVTLVRQRRVAPGGAAGAVERTAPDGDEARRARTPSTRAARFSLPDAAWGRPVRGARPPRRPPRGVGGRAARRRLARTARSSPRRTPCGASRSPSQLDLPPAEAGAVSPTASRRSPRPARLVTVGRPLPAARRAAPTSRPARSRPWPTPTPPSRGAAARPCTVRQRRPRLEARAPRHAASPSSTRSSPRDRVLQNAAAVLMADDERFDLDALARAWDDAEAALAASRRDTEARWRLARQGGARRAR